MKTMLLDRTDWDLCVDAEGNMAAAIEPYQLAQDAASAIKLFRGELWYDTVKGVPYFEQILGKSPPLQLLKNAMEAAAMTVPGVVQAVCSISSYEGRLITGQVQVTDVEGNITNAGF
jgi:hypothetical protein